MQKLLALSIKSTVIAILTLSVPSFAIADDDVDNEELSYMAEMRKEAVKQATQSAPEAMIQEQTELLNEEEKKAIADASKQDMGKINKVKPAFAKPKIAMPEAN